MKTIKLFFGQLFICLSIGGYAQSFSLDVEKVKATDNFIVNISNPVAAKLSFLIKDKDDKSLLQESFMYVEKIKKVLFLGSLQPGDYVVEIFNGEETKSATIKVNGTDKTVHPENGKTLVVGFSKLKADNSIDIIVHNKLNKNVSLKIFKNNNLMSTEELGNGGELIKKILRFDKSDKGNFMIKVGTKENMYQYKISQS
jgi:hypothetical protein